MVRARRDKRDLLKFTWEDDIDFRVLDQGIHDTCAYVSLVSAIEYRILAKDKNALQHRHLSIQHAIQLCPPLDNGGARFHTDIAKAIIRNGGLVFEDNLPYTGAYDPQIVINEAWEKYNCLRGFYRPHPDDDITVKAKLEEGGPIVGIYEKYNSQCRHGRKLITKQQGQPVLEANGTPKAHSVVVVAHGKLKNGQHFMRFLDSQGEDYGFGGYSIITFGATYDIFVPIIRMGVDDVVEEEDYDFDDSDSESESGGDGDDDDDDGDVGGDAHDVVDDDNEDEDDNDDDDEEEKEDDVHGDGEWDNEEQVDCLFAVELSLALHYCFTEISVPPVSDLEELRDITFKRLVNTELTSIMDAMLNFWEWFNQLRTEKMLTVRDLISCIEFVNVTNASLRPDYAFLHGLFLVLLDGLCLGTGISKGDAPLLGEKCFSFILKLLEVWKAFVHFPHNAGLNAVLDHRAKVFTPEPGPTFKCPPSLRFLACQNPFSHGGGRKGLQSCLNRFTKVYIDELAEDDCLFMCSSLYPSIPGDVLSKLILFNKRLHEEIMLYHKFAKNGSPWEFNLRDALRSCQIIQGMPEKSISDSFENIIHVQSMRTAADHQLVLELCEEVFGEKPFINPYPRVELNPECLFVGTSAIKRNTFQSWSPLYNQLNIMPYILHSLEAAAHSVQHQWLCILVGPSSSAKTSLIRLLAQLTGNVLNELNLSSGIDISELFGCFEQYIAYWNIKLIDAKIERYVNQYFSLQLEFSMAAFVSERKGIIAKWFAFLSATDSGLASTSTFSHLENWGNMIKSLSLLVDIIEQLKLDMENYDSLVSGSTEELDRMKAILKLRIDQKKESFSAKFEWVTGLLIKAIENGEWLVLENANLCNPTVLDRINSLVEPSGSISINERGIVDGSPMVINPSYGEVSRAMRNRGVEIFLMQPYWLLDEASDHSCAEFELKDVKRFIVLSGIPFAKSVDSMAKAHLYDRNEGLKIDVQVTYLELSRWIQLFQQLLRKGDQTLWSLRIIWEHTVFPGRGCGMGDHRLCKSFVLIKRNIAYVWPVPLKLSDFIWYSRETSVEQNRMYLEYLVVSVNWEDWKANWNKFRPLPVMKVRA